MKKCYTLTLYSYSGVQYINDLWVRGKTAVLQQFHFHFFFLKVKEIIKKNSSNIKIIDITMRSASWIKCSLNVVARGIRFVSTDTITEIERKFPVTEDILKAVQKWSAGISNKKEIVDSYFDGVSFSHTPFPLTTRDIWLRKRNQVFELKWPQNNSELPRDSEVGNLSGIDFYLESTSWPTIAETLKLASISLSSPLPSEKESEKRVESWLSENKICRFATIKTMRQRFQFELPIGKIGMKWIISKNKPNDSIKTYLINVDIDDVEYCNIDYSDKDVLPIGDETLISEILGSTYKIGEIELLRADGDIPSGFVHFNSSIVIRSFIYINFDNLNVKLY